jgi:hypothetical protein
MLFVAPWIGMKTHHIAIDMYICLPVRLFEPVGLYHNIMSEYIREIITTTPMFISTDL